MPPEQAGNPTAEYLKRMAMFKASQQGQPGGGGMPGGPPGPTRDPARWAQWQGNHPDLAAMDPVARRAKMEAMGIGPTAHGVPPMMPPVQQTSFVMPSASAMPPMMPPQTIRPPMPPNIIADSVASAGNPPMMPPTSSTRPMGAPGGTLDYGQGPDMATIAAMIQAQRQQGGRIVPRPMIGG